ncbi:cell division protein PerM [Salinibacterium hongtaonis]|uniref:cell division protein PerM n=1 Tax=Homoserinimonas hongtaonis TaxID=2079791 RepID=UPI0018EF946C|nr:DUF6350 family protein [Salinibacterium hongtaonis]
MAMNRPLTAVFSALEALLVVGIGIGIPLVPLSLMWGFHYELQVDWAVFWRASVDIWMLGHGASVSVAPDAALGAAMGIAQAIEPFTLSLAPLGFALLTVLLGHRAGRRIAETPHSLLGLGVAAGTFALLALVAALTAVTDAVRPSVVQGTLLPTLVFVAGLVAGAGITRYRLQSRPRDVFDRAWVRLTDWPASARMIVGGALIGGSAAVAAIVAVASIVLAVLIAVNYAGVIALYEGAHAGVLGGVALTVAQLAFVPNFVVWAASWLVGPGFAIGAGSSVSPLATALGPMPGVPVLAALPTGEFAWGFLGMLVPVIAGFFVGALMRWRVPQAGRSSLWVTIASGASVGVVAGVILGLLSWWSGGSGGPGRLSVIGPDPLWVALCVALEVGVACTLGLAAASRGSAEAVLPATSSPDETPTGPILVVGDRE